LAGPRSRMPVSSAMTPKVGAAPKASQSATLPDLREALQASFETA
jgi:hypothetical protein